jgi:hypothetical protein
MATDLHLAARMVTVGGGAAAAPAASPLKMVVDDDRGLLATGCPVPRCRDRMTGPRSSPSAAGSASKKRGAGSNWP